ncbi:MAG: dihydrolipoyl dehydrogenase [Pseudomonadota bacterium]
MTELFPKVLVIGGGPGGYVAAIRCGQLGLDTVLVEADRLGGTCLIRGCIPSKSMIEAADKYDLIAKAAKGLIHGISLEASPKADMADVIAWKDGVVDKLNGGVTSLLRRAKVKILHGWGRFSDAKTCHVDTPDGTIIIRPEHVILATGSKPVALPNLAFDSTVISSTEALSLNSLPNRLVVVGAGYIGMELGGAFAKLGSNVTIVEAADRILPQYDEKLVAPVKKAFESKGVNFKLSAKAEAISEDGLSITMEGGHHEILAADKVLVTVGRAPLTEGWGLEEMAVKMDGRFVAVDEQCATSSRNVWAIGDLVGEPMLAHKASAQGEMVAEIIAGKRRRFDPVAIPSVCYTDPEIVCVGIGPGAHETTESVFPLAANGRALTMGADEGGGFIRIISEKHSHRILGVQAVGRHVSELSATFTHAIENGLVLEDVAGVIHAHPTLSEAFHEAALQGLGHAIHV